MVLISTESAHAQGTRKHSSTSGDTLVIYHSRSGATKTMAQEITVWFGVRMAPIEAEEYTEDFAGWRKAYDHAWNKKPAVIKPEGADLSRYKLLFLGSPIWWYSPSPPLWTFVKNSDLTGCKVVLFNTFNSSFDQKEIDRFGKLVEQRGGRLIDHIWVRRGRIYWQKSEKELIEESNRILSEKAADWLE
ncbi:MAG: flavodoxin/nitric oxide synthase [Nitrospinota bacterium]|nr:flavodoxin/nitric oxide synthase [Nitrospinota bacterium]